TGGEGRLVLCAVPVWVVSAGLLLGAGRYALIGLLAALAAMVVVAYLPAFRPGPHWAFPPLSTVYPALGHGAVGGGQAVLFVSIAHGLAARGELALATVPLLVGVPVVELAVAWHQRRVAVELSTVDSRGFFRRQLTRVGLGTLALLTVPVLLGGAL